MRSPWRSRSVRQVVEGACGDGRLDSNFRIGGFEDSPVESPDHRDGSLTCIWAHSRHDQAVGSTSPSRSSQARLRSGDLFALRPHAVAERCRGGVDADGLAKEQVRWRSCPGGSGPLALGDKHSSAGSGRCAARRPLHRCFGPGGVGAGGHADRSGRWCSTSMWVCGSAGWERGRADDVEERARGLPAGA